MHGTCGREGERVHIDGGLWRAAGLAAVRTRLGVSIGAVAVAVDAEKSDELLAAHEVSEDLPVARSASTAATA